MPPTTPVRSRAPAPAWNCTGSRFSLDRDYRLPQGCEPGQAAGFGPTVTSLGEWQCSQYALASETCPSGQFARATDDDGALLCAAASTGSAGGSDILTATIDDGPGIPSDLMQHEVLRLRVGAGTWAIQAKAQVRNRDRDLAGDCRLHEVAPGVTMDLLRAGGSQQRSLPGTYLPIWD